jgi:hypothetical protein
MDEQEYPDVVDVFYRQFLRPLGNLVITFAQAEAALIEIITELNGGDEDDEKAASTLVGRGQRDPIREIIQSSGFQGFELEDLTENLEAFWEAKDKRNRLIHDEWWVGLDEDDRVGIGTRGIPRGKSAEVVWGEPTLEEIWRLARLFREHRSAFSHYAYMLRKRREPPETSDDVSAA